MNTISIKEYIGNRFDKFYDDCEFKDVELSRKLTHFLEELEEDLIDLAKQNYTTEAEEIRQDAYNEGYEDGYDSGHIKGYNEGYDRGHDEGYEDGYQTAKEE